MLAINLTPMRAPQRKCGQLYPQALWIKWITLLSLVPALPDDVDKKTGGFSAKNVDNGDKFRDNYRIPSDLRECDGYLLWTTL